MLAFSNAYLSAIILSSLAIALFVAIILIRTQTDHNSRDTLGYSVEESSI